MTKSPPWYIKALFKVIDKIQFGTLKLTTPEGEALSFGNNGEPYVEVTVHSWQGLKDIITQGDVGLGSSYIDGHYDCADLTALMRLGVLNQSAVWQVIYGNLPARIINKLRHLFRGNSRQGSKKNIRAHYDLGNDFYRLWLDQGMTYSSGLFSDNNTDDLSAAQTAKYQHIIDLGALKAGDKVLEIGCGWGGFAEYAALQGIRVHGITISQAQLRHAQQRIQQAGISDLVTLDYLDYRDIKGQYDAIVSIEMFEAVGRKYWPIYFQQLKACLRPGGCAILQLITISDEEFENYAGRSDFIQQYIFPGGMLPSPHQLQLLADTFKLTINAETTFAQDYARTLKLWHDNFNRQKKAVLALGFDNKFIRLWDFYLSYCEAGFKDGPLDVVHYRLEHQP